MRKCHGTWIMPSTEFWWLEEDISLSRRPLFRGHCSFQVVVSIFIFKFSRQKNWRVDSIFYLHIFFPKTGGDCPLAWIVNGARAFFFAHATDILPWRLFSCSWGFLKIDHAHILHLPKNCYPPKDEDLDLGKSGLEKIFETILMLIVYNWVPIKHQQDQLSPEELKKSPPGRS